jgi:tetratricopeptide (TPR) repeat protein
MIRKPAVRSAHRLGIPGPGRLSIALCLGALLTAAPAAAQTEIPVAVGEVDSTTLEILLFDGELYLEEGNWQAAALIFRRIVELNPDHVEARLFLARSLTFALLNDEVPPDKEAELGSEALRHFRWTLDRRPGHRESLEALRLLAQKFAASSMPEFRGERARLLWERGDRAMSQELYGDAVSAFREALRVEPDAAGARRALADALRMNGQLDPAQTLYQKELILNPQDFRAMAGLGEVLRLKKDLAGALDAFRGAYELDPTYPPAWNGIVQVLETLPEEEQSLNDRALYGQALVSAQEWKQAERLLSEVVEEDPQPGFRKALAVSKYFQGKTQEALGILRQVHTEIPEDLEVVYYLGAGHLRLGMVEQGREYLENVLRVDPNSPNACKLLGMSLAETPGREMESVEMLGRAHDMGAPIRDYDCVMGSLYMRAGRDDHARKHLKACLEQRGDYAPAHLGLGILADRAGRKGEAIVHLERYLDQSDPQPGVLIRLGVAYLRVGREADGYHALRTIFEIDDAFAPPKGEEVTEVHLLEMASFYLASVQSFDDAIFIGEKLLAESPESSVYNNNLAMVYADADRKAERAHELAVKANRLDPDNPGHMDTLGWTLVRLGRHEEAESQFLRAVELTPEESRNQLSEVYYHLGLLYQLTGRDKASRKYLKLALENPPTPFLRDAILDLMDR